MRKKEKKAAKDENSSPSKKTLVKDKTLKTKVKK